MNIHELDSYQLSDAIKFHDRLNHRLWSNDEHLHPQVRDKLLEISQDFQEFLGVPDLDVKDITISGSNAAYNYTNHSDIDLHLVVDLPTADSSEVYRELFDAKKYQYNDQHNIKIGGYSVELYVQNPNQEHHSQGIYSLLRNSWISVPKRKQAKIDDISTRSKYQDLSARINDAITSSDFDCMTRLMAKIKHMRQSGLEQQGEFGSDNLAFKMLRANGLIEKLVTAKTAARDQQLSLQERMRPKPAPVRYGFAEDVSSNPSGVSPSTKMFLETENDNEQTVYDFIAYAAQQLDIEKMPHIELHTDPDWSARERSFGRYSPETHTLEVNLANRHIMDILRTVAHELTHCKQHLSRPLPDHAGNTGSAWENQANAVAGAIMRDYAQANPEKFGDHALGEEYDTMQFASEKTSAINPYGGLKDNQYRGGISEAIDKKISFKVQKGKGKFSTTLTVNNSPAGIYQYDSNTGRSIAEVYPEFKGKGLGKLLVLHAIYTAAQLGLDFQEDESRTAAYDNVLDSLSSNGYIVDDDGYWYVTGEGEQYLKQSLNEASGYIPSEKQKNDPRFIMALSGDVRPGQTGQEANKMRLVTDAQGRPQLLQANGRVSLAESIAEEFELFEEQDLFEINMGGKNLRKEAAKTGAMAGMEFEMIVSSMNSNDSDNMPEPDYDQDQRCSSIEDAVNFFHDGDYNGRGEVEQLRRRMQSDYIEWLDDKIANDFNRDEDDYIRDWLRNNVNDDEWNPDELAGDEQNQAFDLFAAGVINDASGDYYQQAYTEYREENQDSYDESDWLAAEDLDTMSGVENVYDITWPHWTTNDGYGEVDATQVAEEFSQAVGREVRVNTQYHQSGARPGPNNQFYIVEPDGSLEGDNDGDTGLEFVSPPLPIDEIMLDLNKVKAWADNTGCYTNDSTGLHINISVPNYNLDRLDFVKLALLMGDEYVLDQFGRVGNTYAKSAMGKVRDHVRNRPYEAKYLLDKMKGHMGELASKAIHSGITDKYTSINTKDGHIEFRSPGGDWLDDNFSKIENTLLRFTVALSAAMDPAAYREEYLKKLYKILAPKDEKDPLSIFAKYAAGELPATALKSFVRQAQADRKAKKSGEAIVNGHRWRVALKPELGGGVVEVIATDPIDAKKQAIRQTPNWKFVDDDALTVTRLDEPAAGATTTGPHPEGRGRPTDPNGRLAIVRRDDPLVFAYSSGTPSPAPDYLFRFTLPDGYSQAQLRAVLAAWAARQNANAADYMIVDTTQFAAPEQPAAPESGSVQWNIVDDNGEIVHTFWNTNVQADANAAALAWVQANWRPPLNMAARGPFEVVPAAIPGSTVDIQQRRAAGGEFTGSWQVMIDGEEVYRFSGIGNNQNDANQHGRSWILSQIRQGTLQPAEGAEIEVLPIMS